MVVSKAGFVQRLALVLITLAALPVIAFSEPVTCPIGGYPMVSCPIADPAVMAQTIQSRFRGIIVTPCGQISVCVNDGIVVLSGCVQTRSQKDIAGILAWSVRGVERVENRLLLSPQKNSDLNIARKVMTAIGREVYSTQQVRAMVLDGVVTLTGVVNDEEIRTMIGLAAESIEGVTAVHNQLIVSNSYQNY